MSTKTRLKRTVERTVALVSSHAEQNSRNRRAVDPVLQSELARPEVISSLNYPAVYLDILRTCIEPVSHSAIEVKSGPTKLVSKANRFNCLLNLFSGMNFPPVDFPTARDIALVADHNCSLADSYELNFGGWTWGGDVGLHFYISSSFGSKGRILYNIVRMMRPERSLELGTAYGMSSLFILAAMKKYANAGRLATIEGGEPQFSLSSSVLKARYPDAVSCNFGYIQNVLPGVLQSLGPIDFAFHDAGHDREDYIKDFDVMASSLNPGAVVMFDDIKWEKPAGFSKDPRSYEGWQHVVSNPRVKRAFEIDDAFGLLYIE